MYLKKLKIENFRNHNKISLEDFSKINLIIGNNGSGKTSIVEAINICSIGKSFKTNNMKEIIKFNKNNSNINITIFDEKINNINVNIGDGNIYLFNENKISLNKMFGKLNILLFEPSIFSVFMNNKVFRRKYIDNEISKLYPIHHFHLTKVKKIEAEKKLILKSSQNIKLLNIINKQLSILYKQIIEFRSLFCKEINKYFNTNINLFKLKSKQSSFIYESILINKDSEQILKILNKFNEKEILNKKIYISTSFDNFDIHINFKSIITFGSQGQKRSSLLSLIKSTSEVINKVLNIKPILILDDVFSELDKTNRLAIYSCFSSVDQVFITATDDIKFSENILVKKYYI